VRPPSPFSRINTLFFTILAMLAAVSLAAALSRAVNLNALHLDASRLVTLNTVFLSILIEAFPFILLGVIVSSSIQVLVPSETVLRLFPRSKGLGLIVALFAGLFFPVCDCAVIPVAARLVRKGVPLPTAVTFMLAAPIVNPLAIASTYYAFPGRPAVVLYRIGLGAVVALAAGMLSFWQKRSVLLGNFLDISYAGGCCSDSRPPIGIWQKIEAISSHAVAEFFDVGRYLVAGALLSGIFQTMVPKDIIVDSGSGFALSLLMMMLFAFLLSVCSTSDAFIARTFVNQIPLGAVMGFMILGPMIDMKNLLMLLGRFRKGFVVSLVVSIFGVTYALLFLAGRWL
jgi:uncharacterized membrane protein YraQ (UPF0718 family)